MNRFLCSIKHVFGKICYGHMADCTAFAHNNELSASQSSFGGWKRNGLESSDLGGSISPSSPNMFAPSTVS